jgi:prophage regulatory protein
MIQNLPTPTTLPAIGKSRWSVIAQFSPVSKEKFRQLYLEGKAPAPERMGIRCTYFDNSELHRWLADPLSYVAKDVK